MKRTSPAQSVPVVRAAVGEASAVEAATVPTQTPPVTIQEKKGIRVLDLSPIRVSVGDPDGVPLSDRVKAIHLCTNEPVTELAFSTPQKGSSKAYGYDQTHGGGHLRYYPPNEAGSDHIEIRMTARDGCTATATLPIIVEVAEAPPGASPRPDADRPHRPVPPLGVVALSLSAPPTSGRICPVQGTTTALAAGTSITLWVVTPEGELWRQDCQPQVSLGREPGEGHFTGWVQLGDATRGIGKEFLVICEAEGTRSAPAVVRRVE